MIERVLPDTAQTLAHLYRGEAMRADAWRTRLDTTTNWAMTVTAAVSTLTFTGTAPRHSVLVAIFLVFALLVIETRRYRYHDLYIRRVRLLETGFLAPALRNEPPDEDALRELAEMLERPILRIAWVDAFSVRLGRAYGALFGLLLVEWFFRVIAWPSQARSLYQIYEHARIGMLPGQAVLAFMLALLILLLVLFVRSRFMVLPRGEIAPPPHRGLRRVLGRQ
jgi:uncharacterized membrane protein